MKISTISWLIASILPTAAIAQKFQYGSRFPKNKLYNLEPDTIGLEDIDGTVAAFGDFNGDKL
jgi:integrin alpha FG-GAP repeat containing protein 1